MIPSTQELPFEAVDFQSKVLLADSSVTTVHKMIPSVTVTLGNGFVSRVTDLRVIQVKHLKTIPSDSYDVLAGRTFINKFGLIIHGSGKVVLPIPSGDKILFPLDNLSFACSFDDDSLGCYSVCVIKSEPTDRVIPVCSDLEKLIVKSALDDEVSKGWHTLERNHGYQVRLRALVENEKPDIDDQSFVYELMFPKYSTSAQRGRNYASSLYTRLTPEGQTQYKNLVDEYIDMGWWQKYNPATDVIHEQLSPPAPVFLTGPSSGRKPRLVMDLRQLNKLVPPATSPPLKIWNLLATLRLEGKAVTCIADCRQAFYKIKLVGMRLVLSTGLGPFVSDRMCFGAGVGPGTLAGTLGSLIRHVQRHVGNNLEILYALLLVFVDDLVMSADPEVICTLINAVLATIGKAGYDVLFKKYSLVAAPHAREKLLQIAGKSHISLALLNQNDGITLFGCSVSYSGDALILQCNRQSRMKKILEFTTGDMLSKKPSKTEVFRIGGLASYDAGKQHPEMRLAADIIRAIIAGNFNESWTSPCDLQLLTTHAKQAYLCVCTWLNELASDEIDEPCSHLSTLEIHHRGKIHLVLETDASNYAGGFVIKSLYESKETIVWKEASKFQKSKIKWHSNRKELYVLFKGTSALGDIMGYRSTALCTNKAHEPTMWKITIRCDNSACVHWSQKPNNFLKTGKVQERRGVERLLGALQEEIDNLRKYATVNVEHIEGSQNTEADRLSRLLEDRTQNELSLGYLLENMDCSTELIETALLVYDRSGNTAIIERLSDHVGNIGNPGIIDSDKCPIGSIDPVGVIDTVTEECPIGSIDRVGVIDTVNEECPIGSIERVGVIDTVYRLRNHGYDANVFDPFDAISQPKGGRMPAALFNETASTFELISISDQVRVLSHDDHLPVSSLAESISRQCNHLSQAYNLVSTIRFCIYTWKAVTEDAKSVLQTSVMTRSVTKQLKVKSIINYPFDDWSKEDEVSFVHSLQSNDEKLFSVRHGLPSCGPMFLLKSGYGTECIYYRVGDPSGSTVWQYVLPKSALITRRLVIRSAHVDSIHSGFQGTMGRISQLNYHLLSPTPDVRKYCEFCIVCQTLHAKRNWTTPPSIGKEGELSMEHLSSKSPYYCVGVDYLALGSKIKVVSITDYFSHHVTWKIVQSENTLEVIQVLMEVQLDRGGMKVVIVDQAAYFRSPKFRDLVHSKLGARVILLNRRSPHCGGFFENPHRQAIMKMTVLLRGMSGKLDKLSVSEQQYYLNRCSLVVNTRPLGQYLQDVNQPITPDSLVLGYTRPYGCISSPNSDGSILAPVGLKNVRENFLRFTHLFLKKQSLEAVKRGKFKHNTPLNYVEKMPVLVLSTINRKLGLSYSLAHVKRVLTGGRSIEVVLPSGVVSTENHYSLVPLKMQTSMEKV